MASEDVEINRRLRYELEHLQYDNERLKHAVEILTIERNGWKDLWHKLIDEQLRLINLQPQPRIIITKDIERAIKTDDDLQADHDQDNANALAKKHGVVSFVGGHVDCLCWRTGHFLRVEGCVYHPWDL